MMHQVLAVKSFAYFALFLLIILCPFLTLAQDLQKYQGKITADYVSPPRRDRPTEVNLDLYILGIAKIDTPSQIFEVKAFIDLKWKDERLAFDPKQIGFELKVFEENGAKEKLKDIWWPDISIINEHGPPVFDNRELTIASDGTVEYKMLIEVELFFRPNLTKFPFDTQTFPFAIQSFGFDETRLVFKMDEREDIMTDDLYLSEWELVESRVELLRKKKLRSENNFSEVLMTITLQRKPQFYIWKIFAPLVLILMVSWSIFWMSDEPLSSRVNITIVGLLTAVAFSFVIIGHLPKVSYLTFMDSIVIGTYIFLVLNVVEDVVEETIKRFGKVRLADRFNAACLVIFVLGYVAMWVLTLKHFEIWTS